MKKQSQKNLEDLHQKFKQMIEEPFQKFLKYNEIDEKLYKLLVKKSESDNNINHKNQFIQLESYKRDTYLKGLLNKINEDRRKKEEEKRKRKELEEENKRKKEEEERKRKELEEEKKRRELKEIKEKNKKKN